ncbi:immunoglobulin kappa light chain-like [Odontesthes bonariensis]
MIVLLAAWILLGTESLIQTTEVPHLISLTVVNLGENVTLDCKVSENELQFFYWYRQPLGHMVQTVASLSLGKTMMTEQFKDSRFTVTAEESQYFLTISNVTKEDEATYYCQIGTRFSQTFINGTFLAVNDYSQQKSVYAKQSLKTESGQLRDSVTLRCPLLRKNKEKEERVLCPAEHSVFWFRAGSEGFDPGIIYTQRNISDEDMERSCSYSLSVRDSSDAGTYHCAVVTCGQILFSEGTKVDTKPEMDPVVIVLGGLLACFVTVTVILIFYVKQKKVCEHCKGDLSGPHLPGYDKSSVEQSNHLVEQTLY